jgi:uncharacterized protein YneF (UPF0154 family)
MSADTQLTIILTISHLISLGIGVLIGMWISK